MTVARISAAERRADFIHAAVRVIAAHGIDGATTRRIAEEAGAPLASLHYCYDSKEELFGDVYEFVGQRFQEVLTVPDSSADLRSAARHLLRALMECYFESADFTAATIELMMKKRHKIEKDLSTGEEVGWSKNVQVAKTNPALAVLNKKFGMIHGFSSLLLPISFRSAALPCTHGIWQYVGVVYGEKAILVTEAREHQSRLVKLSDKWEKSLSVLDEVHDYI